MLAALSRRGGGEPLPDALRARMEQRFGARFESRDHPHRRRSRPRPRAIGANAFTVGEDIFFAEGQYGSDGDELLVHELTHVVQAQQGRTAQGGMSHRGDALEREAEDAARRGPAPDPAATAVPEAAPAPAAAQAPAGEMVLREDKAKIAQLVQDWLKADPFVIAKGGALSSAAAGDMVRVTAPKITATSAVKLKLPDGKKLGTQIVKVGPIQALLSSNRVGVYEKDGKKVEQGKSMGQNRDAAEGHYAPGDPAFSPVEAPFYSGNPGDGGNPAQSQLISWTGDPGDFSDTIRLIDQPGSSFVKQLPTGGEAPRSRARTDFNTSAGFKSTTGEIVALAPFGWSLAWDTPIADDGSAKADPARDAITTSKATDAVVVNSPDYANKLARQEFDSVEAAMLESAFALLAMLPAVRARNARSAGFIEQALTRNPTFKVTVYPDRGVGSGRDREGWRRLRHRDDAGQRHHQQVGSRSRGDRAPGHRRLGHPHVQRDVRRALAHCELDPERRRPRGQAQRRWRRGSVSVHRRRFDRPGRRIRRRLPSQGGVRLMKQRDRDDEYDRDRPGDADGELDARVESRWPGKRMLSSPVLRRATGAAPGKHPLELGDVDGQLRDLLLVAAASPGQPLDRASAGRFGAAYGRDLSDVRVHTDVAAAAAADAVQASAFAVGTDVFFASGRFAPGTADGDQLLAHELAHTVQHADGTDATDRDVSRSRRRDRDRRRGRGAARARDTHAGIAVRGRVPAAPPLADGVGVRHLARRRHRVHRARGAGRGARGRHPGVRRRSADRLRRRITRRSTWSRTRSRTRCSSATPASSPARSETFAGALSDPLEREAEHAAAIVLSGGRAQITGSASGGQVQNFSPIEDLKKAVKERFKEESGYDTDKNTFEADLDLSKALWVVGWKLDLSLHAVGLVKLKIDFNTNAVTLSGAGLGLDSYTSDSFSCGKTDVGAFTIDTVWDGTTDFIKSAAFVTDSITIAGVKYHDAKAKPAPLDLTIESVLVAKVTVAGVNIGGKADWLLALNVPAAVLHGIHYPGMVTVNASLAKTSFVLKEIGGVLSDGNPNDPTLTKAPDVVGKVLPADSHIEIALVGTGAVVNQEGEKHGDDPGKINSKSISAGFKHFVAQLMSGANQELVRVEIDDFQAGDSAKGTGAQIGRVSFKGSPDMVDAVLSSDPVNAKVAGAIKLMKEAGVDPKVTVNAELKGIGVGATKNADKQVDAVGGHINNIDATVAVENVGARGGSGSLNVKFAGLAMGAQGSVANASFTQFKATLSIKDTATVSVTLNGKGPTGKIDFDANGEVAGAQGFADFIIVGDITPLVDSLGKKGPELPPEVTAFLPTLKKLGLGKATVTGSVAAAGSKEDDPNDPSKKTWVVGVGSDLGVEIPAGNDTKVALGLKALHIDKDGALLGGGFQSMLARIIVKDKDVASISVDGCEAWKSDDDGKSMMLKKVVAKGSGTGLGQLAAALNNGAGLPNEAKAIVRAVAAHTITGANAIATVNDLNVKQDAEGKETATATSTTAEVWIPNVGACVVSLFGFMQTADGGKQQIIFDRLTAQLNTTKQPKAAFMEIKGEKTDVAGGGVHFTAKKVHAEGDGALLDQLIKGVTKEITNLPEEIQGSLKLVDEFMVNGKGSVDLNNLDVKKDGDGTVKAKTEFTTDSRGARRRQGPRRDQGDAGHRRDGQHRGQVRQLQRLAQGTRRQGPGVVLDHAAGRRGGSRCSSRTCRRRGCTGGAGSGERAGQGRVDGRAGQPRQAVQGDRGPRGRASVAGASR